MRQIGLRLSLVMSLCLGGLCACGGSSEYQVLGSAKAAGADGIVEVEELEGGNVLATIHLEHLPPPGRIAEGASVYVVWFTGQGQQPIKAGTLAYDDDARTGHLVATSPLKAFEVKVTAENNAAVATPSEAVVVVKRVAVDD
ncbi:MAG: hypothetical protein MJD61_22760 [Proteobacteria bacterium]|nr:hypothetical protein [Pseudomonadota bacterium]